MINNEDSICDYSEKTEKKSIHLCLLENKPYGEKPHIGVCQKKCPYYKNNTEQTPSIITKITKVVKSVVKTQILGKDKTTDKEFADRMLVCKYCPGNHVKLKKGQPFTCGEMIKSLTDKKQKTCGCVLTLKARDRKEDCPFSYWPKIPPESSEPNT